MPNIESARVPVAIEADVMIVNVVDTPAITPASPVRDSESETGDTPSKKAVKTVAPSRARTTPSKGKHQRFPKAWLITYSWLSYDPIDESMHGRLCKKQRGEGVWVTGTRNFRVKSVALHITSKASHFLYRNRINTIDDEIVSFMAALAHSSSLHGLNVCVDNLLPSMLP